jgi:hypothetical protein
VLLNRDDEERRDCHMRFKWRGDSGLDNVSSLAVS